MNNSIFITVISYDLFNMIPILFGSFDPVTLGHITMLILAKKKLEAEGETITKCLLIPTTDKYPHKKLTSFGHRLNMLLLATHEYPFIKIDIIEKKFKEWKRTREVLELLKEKYKEDKLVFICGSDKLKEFENLWKKEDVEYIINTFSLIVIPRNKEVLIESFKNKFDIDTKKIRMAEHISETNKDISFKTEILKEKVKTYPVSFTKQIIKISSTKAREDMAREKTSTCLDPLVESYCLDKKLYF